MSIGYFDRIITMSKPAEAFTLAASDCMALQGWLRKTTLGQPRKLSDKKVREILTLMTQRIPAEATHWSLRLMARYADTTVHQVRQVWQAAGLKPSTGCRVSRSATTPTLPTRWPMSLGFT